MPRVYTYTRSATDDPNNHAKHDAALQAWLAKYPDHSLAGAFEDRGVSGLTPPEQRTGYKALLAALQEAPAEVVLVPALEHISRDRGVPSMVCAQLRLGATPNLLSPRTRWMTKLQPSNKTNAAKNKGV